VAATRPNAVLRGGPGYLTGSHRVLYVDDLENKLKLPVRNGYEHFTPTAEEVRLGPDRLRVFVWTARTYIAE
jgi:hypothetical protein